MSKPRRARQTFLAPERRTRGQHSAASPSRRRARVIASVAATLALAGASILAFAPAAFSADTGSVSAVTVTDVADGTAPFDADNLPGDDASATNGILRTNDTLTIAWGYTVASTGTVTLSETLPAGTRWVTASAAACLNSGSAITNNGRTMTCQINVTASGNSTAAAGSFNLQVYVGGMSNGTVLNFAVTASGITSAALPITVSATPRFQLDVGGLFPYNDGITKANGPGSLSGTPGYRVSVPASFWQQGLANKGYRGLETIADPITFVVTPPSGAVFTDCVGSAGADGVSGANGGVWTCSQTAAGGPISVSITGMDTSLFSAANGGAAAPLAITAFGKIHYWVPASSYPTGAIYSLQSTSSGFHAVSTSGQLDFGTGTSPGQPYSGTCIQENNYTAKDSNCSVAKLDLKNILPSFGFDGPGAGALPGQSFTMTPAIQAASLGPDLVGAEQCATWNPAYSTIASTGVAASSNYTVEYGTVPYSTETARRTSDCGTVGDGSTAWYSSVTAAGGPAVVTAVRLHWNVPVVAGTVKEFAIPMVRYKAVSGSEFVTTSNPQGYNDFKVIPAYTQVRTSQTPLQISTYVPGTNYPGPTFGGNAGFALTLYTANIGRSISWDQATSYAGDVRKLTVTPSVSVPAGIDPQIARNVVVTVTLPGACYTYVTGSASLVPTSVSANGVGPDGVACTSDDTGGSILTFSLGDVSTSSTIAPITLYVNVSPSTVMPSSATASAGITSSSGTDSSGANTTMNLNAPNGFMLTKQASTVAAMSNVPYTYTISWANRTLASAGTSQIVDVLPFDGDSRGTTGLGGLTVTSVTAPSSVTVEYSTTAAATAQSAVASDPTGGTGVTWVSTPPSSGVTALRFTTGVLAAGASGFATVAVTPGSVSSTAKIVNDLSGKASLVATALQHTATNVIRSASTQISGHVYDDLDYSWSRTTGDTGIAGAVLTLTGYSFGPNGIDDRGSNDDVPLTTPLTTTTDSTGSYVFDGLLPGRYSVTAAPQPGLVAAALPASSISVSTNTPASNVDLGFQPAVTAPIARDDTAVTPVGTPVTVRVLDNDTVDPSAVITAVSTASPSGTVTVSSDRRTITYTPQAGYLGVATFTYQVTDKQHQTATAKVTVTMLARPVAQPDTAITPYQTPVTIDALANDTGTGISIASLGSVSNGSAQIVNGKIVFTPAAGFAGTLSFAYTIQDVAGATSTSTVTVQVASQLVAIDDSARTGKTQPVTIDALANDSGTGISITSVGAVSGGTAQVVNGKIVFTPDGVFVGSTQFAYTVTDVTGATATATVTVVVDDVPHAVDDQVTIAQDAPVDLLPMANDSGVGITITGTTNPSHGAVVVGANGKVTYTPAAGYVGDDSFTYTITDRNGLTSTATVVVHVVTKPAAVDDYVTTGLNTPVDIDALANDSGTGLAITSVGTSTSGTATVLNGKVHFAPVTGFVGTTVFPYTITDVSGTVLTAHITVVVQAAPVAVDDSAWTPQGTPVTIDLLGNDSGVGIAIHGIPTSAQGTIGAGSAGQIRFTPNPGVTGTVTFPYTIVDSVGQTASATVTVVVDPAPVAVDDARRIPVDTSVTVPVLSNDTGTGLTVRSIQQPSHGTAAINPDGSVTYIPAAGFVGVDRVPYVIADRGGVTATATLTVTVVGAPIAVDDSYTLQAGSAAVLTVLSNDSGDGISILSFTPDPDARIAIDPSGAIAFAPNGAFVGTTIFSYTIVDSVGQASTAKVTVVVTPAVSPTPTPTPTPTPSPDSLARTGLGDVVGQLGVAGLGMILLGIAAGLLGRRRRQ